MPRRRSPGTAGVEALISPARTLAVAAARLKFGPPVTCVYNPLAYAWRAHEQYLRAYGAPPKRVVFLGMNPGPFGMVQTGVPFGDVGLVRSWVKIDGPVNRPLEQHPRRPVFGFACTRGEVSGRRLWGLFAKRFGTAREFFRDHLVLNYCPLAFVEASGRNRTPDKLPVRERDRLFSVCDEHLRVSVSVLQPEWLIGVGDFAFKRALAVLGLRGPKLGRILHPSPASPAANRNWEALAEAQLRDLGVW
ncbi:MAG TPA: uracil-DNA glycosylase family protein [Verrucomicrobiae bacterium]